MGVMLCTKIRNPTKCITEILGHQVPAEEFQCTLVFILPVCEVLLEESNPAPLKDISLCNALMMAFS